MTEWEEYISKVNKFFTPDGMEEARQMFLNDFNNRVEYITLCDVVEYCEDCPRYADDCDGKGKDE